VRAFASIYPCANTKGHSEHNARRRFWNRIATPRLLRESEPPPDFQLAEKPPMARVVEVENLTTKLKLSRSECNKFKVYAGERRGALCCRASAMV
jgi:hypothetical protein